MKQAPTKGTTKNAFGAIPYFRVNDDILAKALAVVPIIKPTKPLLMMAASLLKSLGAEGFVSEATIDAAGSITSSKGCAITGVKAEGGSLSFDRQDETLPFPIPDNARAILPIAPDVLALSQYTLKVTGLKDANYAISINGAPSSPTVMTRPG